MVGTIEKTRKSTKDRKIDKLLDTVSQLTDEKMPLEASTTEVEYKNNSINNKVDNIRDILGWDNSTRLGIVTITPEMAKQLLEFNTRNRRVIKGSIEKYSQSLREGSFTLSNDMITFDSNGILSNGQHRLLAVINTGISLTSCVMLGVEQSSEMDRGAKRDMTDNIIIAGNIGSELCLPTKIKVAKTVFDHLKNRQKYTTTQLENYMTDNSEAINDAYNNNLIHLQGKLAKLFNRQVAAAFLAAVIYYKNKYSEDPDTYNDTLSKLVDIRNVLTSGVTVNKNDSFVVKLRDKLLTSLKDGRRLTADSIFRATQYTIYHYCNDTPKEVILCNKDYFI